MHDRLRGLFILPAFLLFLNFAGAARAEEGTGTGVADAGGKVSFAKVTATKVRKSGWVEKAGKRFFYIDGKKATGWQVIQGKRFYFNEKGIAQTGWQRIDGHTYYFGPKGACKTGIQTIKKKVYFFRKKGKLAKGWVSFGDKDRYFGKDGAMVTGWQTIKGQKYYFGAKGACKKGFQVIQKKTYYFAQDGHMVTGWKKVDGKRYYFGEDGQMITGRKVIGEKSYFFDEKTGAMDPKQTQVRKMSELEKLCADIVSKKVSPTDSTNEKLRKLFQYVTYSYGYIRFGSPGGYHWYRSYAKNMISAGGGNCYSYAALYACLVKKATGLPVRVARGMTPGLSVPLTPHGWCEVQINGVWYVFDPDLYRFVYPGSCYYQTMGQIGHYYYNRNYSDVSFEEVYE